jgi:hypothetical protein
MIAQSVKDGTLFTKPADILQTQQWLNTLTSTKKTIRKDLGGL